MALAAFMMLINEKKLLKFKDGGEVCSYAAFPAPPSCLPDLEHHVWRTVHYFPDGSLLHVHWLYLQRLFLQARQLYVIHV
jgi:hypothetical protein